MRPRLNLRVPGNDGTVLATDVYLPDRTPAPVVVTRTPYGRVNQLAEGLGWARRGFAFVTQDVRGRHDSAGAWEPYRDERADGAALARWAHAQSWCDGHLVVTGASYAAYTAWATAVSVPEMVSGVISMVPAMGLPEVKFAPSGILRLAEHAAWWTEHGDARGSRPGLAATMFGAEPGLLDHLPVADLGSRLWAELPRWWSAVADGPAARSPEVIGDDELAGLGIPALHLGGWFDLLAPCSIAQWRTAGGALLIGPWEHQLTGTRTGVIEHGAAAHRSLGAIQVDWITEVLAGGTPASVELFVVGEGRWWSGPGWPECDELVLHAHPDGSLRAAPSPVGSCRFVSDPERPNRSRRPGADRADLAARADAVRFSAAPEPIRLVGAPRAVLHADTSAPTTDWVVRLLQHNVDGTVVSLASGSVDTGRDPGPVHNVELTPIAAALPPGAALGLEVTSADFPDLARNPQTGDDRYTSTRLAAATQTVHCGPGGTRVSLPVMEDR